MKDDLKKMPQPDLIFIYIPCRDEAQASAIGRAMVEQKHAACANIFPTMKSIYEWEGKMCTAQEAVLILKTTADKFTEVEQAMRKLHSYEVPCIAALQVADVNEAYRAWVVSAVTRE